MKINIIKNPAGTYSYVSWRLPLALADFVPADRAAIMGGRCVDTPAGPMEPKWPSFKTSTEAVEYARQRGFEAAL